MLLDNMKVLLSQYVILPLIVKLEIDCLLFTSKTSLSESLFVFGEKVRNFFTSFFIFVPTRLLLSADNVKADLEISFRAFVLVKDTLLSISLSKNWQSTAFFVFFKQFVDVNGNCIRIVGVEGEHSNHHGPNFKPFNQSIILSLRHKETGALVITYCWVRLT